MKKNTPHEVRKRSVCVFRWKYVYLQNQKDVVKRVSIKIY